MRDVLDTAFQYQLESIQLDNSVGKCAMATCDAIIDAGNGNVGNLLQLDINANAVWAILFSVKMP